MTLILAAVRMIVFNIKKKYGVDPYSHMDNAEMAKYYNAVSYLYIHDDNEDVRGMISCDIERLYSVHKDVV